MAGAKRKELLEQLDTLDRSEEKLKSLVRNRLEVNRQLNQTRDEMAASMAAFHKKIEDLERELAELEAEISEESRTISGEKYLNFRKSVSHHQ